MKNLDEKLIRISSYSKSKYKLKLNLNNLEDTIKRINTYVCIRFRFQILLYKVFKYQFHT